MKKYTAILGVLGLFIVVGGVYALVNKNSVKTLPPKEVKISIETPGKKEYVGNWFKVKYPEAFIAKAEGSDEASFTSADEAVQFYVYSPQWSGTPASYLQATPNEVVVSDTTAPEDISSIDTDAEPIYSKQITRYVTFAAKDGSYKRSFVSITSGFVDSPSSTELSSETRHVFGIKYKDQATYDAYLNEYLAFKESLEQYAD